MWSTTSGWIDLIGWDGGMFFDGVHVNEWVQKWMRNDDV